MIKLERYLQSYLSDLAASTAETDDVTEVDVSDKISEVQPDLSGLKVRFPLSVPVSPSPEELKAGVVMEMFQGDKVIPLTLAVLRIRGDLADVCLMSYAFELATEHDLIVRFPHLLRDTWILEGDLIYSVPLSALESFSPVGSIRDEDCQMMLDYLDGRIKVLPSNRKGAGSFLEVKRRFKSVEQERSAFLASFVFSRLEEAESGAMAGGEPGNLIKMEIQVPDELRDYLESRAKMLPAAGMTENVIFNQYVAGVYFAEQKLLQLSVQEEFSGKFGRLEFRKPGGAIVLYEGIFRKGMLFYLRSVQRSALFSFKTHLEIVLF